ncbi:MAG: PIN domain-containing protein [Lachnospiraceae bacterium]|nr:PIN domain-containing protein [Lachnospiraceae bacterium]
MKVLIDTNVILDVMCAREDFLEASSKVWKYCEINKIVGYISALSIPNIVYILQKELTPEKTQQIIQQLFLIFKIADLKSDDLKKAAAMKTSDYEDALQMVCASRIKADFIITRNIKDFIDSKVVAIKPSELLDRI